MLTISQSELLVNLYDKYFGKGYVIAEWDELFCLYSQEQFTQDDFFDSWEQLKVDNCIIQKFRDNEQVCFCLTDKAKSISQDFVVMQEQTLSHSNAVVQTDSLGRTIVVLPKNQTIEESINEVAQNSKKEAVRSSKSKGFWSGLLGGIFGGLISGGALYYFLSVFVG